MSIQQYHLLLTVHHRPVAQDMHQPSFLLYMQLFLLLPAIQDMIHISARRNPYVQLILYPAVVQGAGAGETIVAGIQYLDQMDVDIIIVGRGGGSIEDLWAFNEKRVAEAIYNCQTPIISAVGHETDTTISDYVADLRAPTPSAAAELAIPEWREILQKISDRKRRLQTEMEGVLRRYRNQLEGYSLRVKYASPSARITEYRQRLMSAEDGIERVLRNRIREERYKLALYSERLSGLSPLKQLERGYGLVSKADGTPVHLAGETRAGDSLSIKLLDGHIDAKVTKTYIKRGRKDGESKDA